MSLGHLSNSTNRLDSSFAKPNMPCLKFLDKLELGVKSIGRIYISSATIICFY